MKKNIVVVLVLIALIGVSTLLFMYAGPIDPYKSENKIEKDKVNLIIDGNWIDAENGVILEDDHTYVLYDIIKENIIENISLDAKNSRVYYDILKPNFKLESDELDKLISSGIKINFLSKKVGDKHYVEIDKYAKLFNLNVQYNSEYQILNIWKFKTQDFYGIPHDTLRIRPEKSIFSRNLAYITAGDSFRIIEMGDKWAKVQLENGICGYALKDKFAVNLVENHDMKELNASRKDWEEENINITWHQIGKTAPDLKSEGKIEGLDVICPTWFSLANERGFIVNNSDMNYVEDAHSMGYKVWGLVDNGFNKELTRKFLNNEDGRKNFIRLLAFYVSLYNLDGINIDFENVYFEDGSLLTSFIKELAYYMEGQNIKLSMAVTVPGGSKEWSLFYERENLSRYMDYMTLMAYDEHWASSPISGSVASINWVEKGIIGSLEEIPSNKLVLGMPYYTRIWEETSQNGKIKNTSKAISMSKVQSIIEEKNLTPIWKEDIGQHYVEYKEGSKTFKIWIEDGKSIEKKLELAKKYNLVGVAGWKKGLETKDIWEVIEENYKK